MNNKFFRIVALILMFTLFSGMVACQNDKLYGDFGEEGSFGTIDRVSYSGTHEISAVDTNDYLVKDGKTD